MYNRKEAEQFLIDTYNFKSTGLKHEENYFTWWFQSFFLFEKFGFDKRKCFFSSLINSGQLDRKTAMISLQSRPEYPALGIEQRVMKYPKRRHEDFPMDKWYDRISKVVRFLHGTHK